MEAIYQMPIDKRNFRKKIAAMGILDKLDAKDKSSSKEERSHFFCKINEVLLNQTFINKISSKE